MVTVSNRVVISAGYVLKTEIRSPRGPSLDPALRLFLTEEWFQEIREVHSSYSDEIIKVGF